jgi:RNA polymerase sigma factor (sigma-70 family)
MLTPLLYYLVDDHGKPLGVRYQMAVAHLHRTFVNKFPKFGDPADISNAVEETARRVARYEIRYGEVKNLHAFIMCAYSNVLKSMIRAGYYGPHEASTSDRDLEALASRTPYREKHKIENAILARQVLQILDEKKRRLVILTAEGFTAKEISERLGISEPNVNTCLHRARAKIKHANTTHIVPKRRSRTECDKGRMVGFTDNGGVILIYDAQRRDSTEAFWTPSAQTAPPQCYGPLNG